MEIKNNIFTNIILLSAFFYVFAVYKYLDPIETSRIIIYKISILLLSFALIIFNFSIFSKSKSLGLFGRLKLLFSRKIGNEKEDKVRNFIE